MRTLFMEAKYEVYDFCLKIKKCAIFGSIAKVYISECGSLTTVEMTRHLRSLTTEDLIDLRGLYKCRI